MQGWLCRGTIPDTRICLMTHRDLWWLIGILMLSATPSLHADGVIVHSSTDGKHTEAEPRQSHIPIPAREGSEDLQALFQQRLRHAQQSELQKLVQEILKHPEKYG